LSLVRRQQFQLLANNSTFCGIRKWDAISSAEVLQSFQHGEKFLCKNVGKNSATNLGPKNKSRNPHSKL